MTWPGGRQRWLAVGLVASLAVNAFFIGAAATDVLRFGKDKGGYGRGALRYELRWLAGRLSPEAMARVEAAVAAGRPDAQRHIDRLRELRANLGGLAAAGEPDRAAIDAVLAEIRGELDAMLGESQAITMDSLLALPPETRAKLAGR